jgi:hypothetical protein
MANFLSFIKGTDYTFNIFNRKFAEQAFIITDSAVGGTFDNIVNDGVTYHYRKADGSTYTGDILYHTDGNIYTGTSYSVDSILLDIIQVNFTPNAGHGSLLYIQSSIDKNMGQPMYILDSAGDVLNPEQYYYILAIGRDAALANLSFNERLVNNYINNNIPSYVEAKKYVL